MGCGEFIGELFRARDITHVEHLQSKNMAEHVILEELYDALLEHVDSIAEMRLARGPVEIEIKSTPAKTNVVAYLEMELIPLIDMAKYKADEKKMNDISAEIDMVKTTVMKKLYKLKNLSKVKAESVDTLEDDDMSQGGILLYKKKCGGGKLNCGGKTIIKRK
jgi:DNA-binding ferritin-like protein